ncbi:MAG: hypothetical protein FWG31_03680 [Oscillospiraceae bacterium]|nr:hypothetical protein [Oscillospiraceae bacterium]
MAKIYKRFANWQQINKQIPLRKFYEKGRMTEKQANSFVAEVTAARVLYKKEEKHVVELQTENIYPRDYSIYGWVRAVFQTMPYDIIIVLNCRSKYFLFLVADTQDRKNITSVVTDKIVTNIYSNGFWVDGDCFDENDLLIRNEPIDWELFPSSIRLISPNHAIEFTTDNDEKVKLPYPERRNVSEDELDEYIAFAKNEYELNMQDEIDSLFDEELDYALSDFWHQTEQRFRSRNDVGGMFGSLAFTRDDDKYNDLYWGFVDGVLIGGKSYEEYMEAYRNN